MCCHIHACVSPQPDRQTRPSPQQNQFTLPCCWKIRVRPLEVYIFCDGFGTSPWLECSPLQWPVRRQGNVVEARQIVSRHMHDDSHSPLTVCRCGDSERIHKATKYSDVSGHKWADLWGVP